MTAAVTARSTTVSAPDAGAASRLKLLPTRPTNEAYVPEAVTLVIARPLRRAEHRGARGPGGRARPGAQASNRGAGHERGRRGRRHRRACRGPAELDAGRPPRPVER